MSIQCTHSLHIHSNTVSGMRVMYFENAFHSVHINGPKVGPGLGLILTRFSDTFNQHALRGVQLHLPGYKYHFIQQKQWPRERALHITLQSEKSDTTWNFSSSKVGDWKGAVQYIVHMHAGTERY